MLENDRLYSGTYFKICAITNILLPSELPRSTRHLANPALTIAFLFGPLLGREGLSTILSHGVGLWRRSGCGVNILSESTAARTNLHGCTGRKEGVEAPRRTCTNTAFTYRTPIDRVPLSARIPFTYYTLILISFCRTYYTLALSTCHLILHIRGNDQG